MSTPVVSTLKYALRDNPLTPDPTDFMAVPQDAKKVTVEDIVERQLTGKGSILKKTECVAVIYGFLDVITENIANGIGFSSDYMILSHSISGVFTSKDDLFDPARHEINYNLRLSKNFKAALEQVVTEKVKINIPEPEVEEFYDIKSDSTNNILTPGHSAELTGILLKIEDVNAAEQGLFFIHSSGTVYKAERVRKNTSTLLTCLMPEGMKKGQYTLEVRTTINGSSDLREGQLKPKLQVV